VKFHYCAADEESGLERCRNAYKTEGCYIVNQEEPIRSGCESAVTADPEGHPSGCTSLGVADNCEDYLIESNAWSCMTYIPPQ
jgi:hypothetical protein